MRLVLDTNVLVSGLLNPHGPPGRLVTAVAAGSILLLYDDRILSEYGEVLRRAEFAFAPSDVDTLLELIEKDGEYVGCPPSNVTLPDPTDLPFLEVAMSGGADALVTGNAKHFKPVRGRYNIRVLSAAEYFRQKL
jgi:putative PIN family toxin of toxin-antitoxin system